MSLEKYQGLIDLFCKYARRDLPLLVAILSMVGLVL